MTKSKINIYKVIFVVLLFVITAVPIFEVHFLLYFGLTILLLLNNDYSISKFTFGLISILLIIVLIGIISSLFFQKTLYDWIKDILYFSKPIFGITLGYLLLKKINNKYFFIKSIVYLAIIFAVYHILGVLFNTNFSTDSINDIRNANGLSNPVELLALIVLLTSYRYDYLKIEKRKVFYIFILVTSLILYFSRTMLVAFAIMMLATNGYAKLTTKGLKYGLVFILISGLFYSYLFSTEFKRDKPGIESFLYKMKIAPSEIFLPTKNIDLKDHKKLWDHWRAYEVSMAYKQMKIKPLSFLNGYGFGSKVDLKFVAPLNEQGIRYIPILHNGYFNVLFKTGLIGFFFYLSFLLLLYIQSYKNKISTDEQVVRNFISALGLYFIFTSLIITGIYNLEENYTFILGGFLFLLSKHTTNQLSNNN